MPDIRVWITPGCTRCHWCQHLVPEVFADSAEGCEIRAEIRSDRQCDHNRDSRTPLHLDPQAADFVEFIAGGCPAKVIQVERQPAAAGDGSAPCAPGSPRLPAGTPTAPTPRA